MRVVQLNVGNAKTVRNNNSSRFGKFVQVLFCQTGMIIGATIVTYLLEKSRTVKQADSERNYHVFYEIVNGANNDERAKYFLHDKVSDYRYLSQSGCEEISGVNDKRNFAALRLALSVLKLKMTEIDSIFRILSSILLFGNIKFTADNQKESVTISKDSSTIVPKISQLLECKGSALNELLCFRKLVVRSDQTLVPLRLDQVRV